MSADDRIVRSAEPLNLEMPFSTLESFITPTERFYVRTHFPVPKIDAVQWRLRIEGEVEKAFEISEKELLSLETRTMAVTLECAGNNRIFLEPKVKGVQWELGAVGNAEWTGVPLSVLLDRAGVKSNANEVILEGADAGTVDDAKAPRGDIRFARSIPLEKARRDVLLVHTMNGERLKPEHGFPLRAIVPGWYAMASIKWLRRIVVTDTPFNGYYQTLDYAYWSKGDGSPTLVPLSLMELKAEIASPANGSTVPADSKVRVHGAAWGGNITKVEISADGGKSWNAAELLPDGNHPFAWKRWQWTWQTPKTPGAKCTLMARATDASGRTQPTTRDPDRGTYMISHLLPIEVTVT